MLWQRLKRHWRRRREELRRCRTCGTRSDRFLPGPRGGMNQNVQCPSCGHWYNMIMGTRVMTEDLGFRSLDLRGNAPTTETRH